MSSTPPQIREYQLPPQRVAGEVVSDYLGEVVELLVSVTEYRVRELRDTAAIPDLIEPAAGVTTATSLPPAARDRLWVLLEEAVSMFELDDLSAVGRRLEGLVRFHSSHPDADWALPADETDRLDRLAQRIAGDGAAPADSVEANLWLFAEYHPSAVTYQSSDQALPVLIDRAGPPISKQIAVAEIARVGLPPELPRLVAAARLRDSLFDVLDGKALHSTARAGVTQIQNWREWVTQNLAYARQPRAENGLGLPGIRPGDGGLVLVGRRRSLIDDRASVRRRLSEETGIFVHTYDWLLEVIERSLSSMGPPPGASRLLLL